MSWKTQSQDKPLYEDLLWSRPQNKRQAGKLLIVGGQAQEFAHIASAYQSAQKSGAGTIKVLLPNSLEKTAGMIPNVTFAQSNKSGSFAKSALAELLDASDWADAVLLGGDLGKNSETTAMIDSFLIKNKKLTIMTDGSLRSAGLGLSEIADMNIDLVIGFASLQKLGASLELKNPFVSNMVNSVLAELLSELSKNHRANLVVQNEGQTWVACDGKVTNTKSNVEPTKLATYCAVWHMQNPTKPLQALTTACSESS